MTTMTTRSLKLHIHYGLKSIHFETKVFLFRSSACYPPSVCPLGSYPSPNLSAGMANLQVSLTLLLAILGTF